MLGFLRVEGGLDEGELAGVFAVHAVGDGDAVFLAELDEDVGRREGGDLVDASAARAPALEEARLELANALVAAHRARRLQARVADLAALLREPALLALRLELRVRLARAPALVRALGLEIRLGDDAPGRLVHGAVHPRARRLVQDAAERLVAHRHRLRLRAGAAPAAATGRHLEREPEARETE